MNELKSKRHQLREDNKKFGSMLRELPRSDWPTNFANLCPRLSPTFARAYPEKAPVRVWRSRAFLVQLFNDPCGFERLSICRCELDHNGGFKDGTSWDDIQRLKQEAGYGNHWAVECYPPDADIVNVANHRHLFLLPEPPAFGWHTPAAPQEITSPFSPALTTRRSSHGIGLPVRC